MGIHIIDNLLDLLLRIFPSCLVHPFELVFIIWSTGRNSVDMHNHERRKEARTICEYMYGKVQHESSPLHEGEPCLDCIVRQIRVASNL